MLDFWRENRKLLGRGEETISIIFSKGGRTIIISHYYFSKTKVGDEETNQRHSS
jgi:hypothetical protein